MSNFERMVIAVYADLKDNPAPDYSLYFLKSLIENFAIVYPQHKFYLIVSNHVIDEFDDKLFKIIFVRIKSRLFYQFRSEQKVLKTIKDINADRLFSYNAFLKTSISQSLILDHVRTKNKFSSKTLEKLKAIFVLSGAEKTFLLDQYKLDPQKIKILYGGHSKLFDLIPDEEKESRKEKYTNGKEYFIYRGSIEKDQNIIPLLKGFSIFKRRQKSSMKLLLMGKVAWQDTGFNKLIGSYKYREDVLIVTDMTPIDEAKIVAAAYAYVQPYSNNLLFSFDALQSGAPVLIDKSLEEEIFLDAALYFESANDADIADKMMLIYKDELLRTQLIEKGKKINDTYNWEKTINIVGQNLQLSGTD